MEKIVLIGPVYPYKGGISHYTGLMYQALAKKYQVEMVSYKLQYPKLLFKKEQRDYQNQQFKIEHTKYLINTCNPFNWISVANRIHKIVPSLIIIQWWHPYFAPCYIGLTRLLKKYKIVFLCHNVFPHDRFPLDRFLAKQTLKGGNSYIVQSKMDGEDLKTIVKNPCYRQTVHPTYNAFKFKNMSKKEARIQLGINEGEQVLLFFGFVKEYKGLKYLLEALPNAITFSNKMKLLVVGDFDNKEEYIQAIEVLGIGEHVVIEDAYVPDQEVQKYFEACDLVVLPYTSATQSGIVQIAYGFEKPVIVTNVGGLPDVVEDGKTGYVVETQNSEALATSIIRYFKDDMEQEFVRNVQGQAYRFSWDRMVEVVEELLKL